MTPGTAADRMGWRGSRGGGWGGTFEGKSYTKKWGVLFRFPFPLTLISSGGARNGDPEMSEEMGLYILNTEK